jgi:hypothetical protein
MRTPDTAHTSSWRLSLHVGALLVCLLAASGETLTRGSWRPYANPSVLVTLGMSKGEVLLKAGQPDLREVVSYGTEGLQNRTVWTYLRSGHSPAVTTLTFQGNRLVRIETDLLNP